ncbi:30S ribosomal protein S8 [bacterium]|nr:30S ribosomal protein S8 [bacterium]
MSDSIGDFLTRIRNAVQANHRVVEVPASNIKKRITEILYDQGFILSYKFVEDKVQDKIKIALKYDPMTGTPAISSIQRASTPGLRMYSGSNDIPRVINGLGVAIVSTSSGVMTDKQARKQNVGGEVICYVY